MYVYYSLSKKVTFNEIDPFYEDPVTNSCSLQNGSHIETSSKLLSELYVTDPEFDENNIKVYDQWCIILLCVPLSTCRLLKGHDLFNQVFLTGLRSSD